MRISTIQRSDLEETLIELNRWKRGRQWGSMPVQLDGRWPLQFGIWLMGGHVGRTEQFFYTAEGPARALPEGQKARWRKSTRCASKGLLRHWLPRSLGAACSHDVSIRGARLRCAFGNLSTICVSPPHSGQVGCQRSSVTDTAGLLVRSSP